MAAGAVTSAPVQDTIRNLKRATAGETTTIGDFLDACGQRAYGPLFLVIGLVAMSPIGAIPGASIVCGTLVLLLALQLGARSGAPWVPNALRRIEIDAARARRSVDWMEPYVQKLSYVTRRRWGDFIDGNAVYGVTTALCLLALSMYPLALVPWGVMAPAAGITVIGLGLLARDGVMIFAGLALTMLAGMLGLLFLFP